VRGGGLKPTSTSSRTAAATNTSAARRRRQAPTAEVVLDEAGQWRDFHPLSGSDLAVDEDEWDARAQTGLGFPPCADNCIPSKNRQPLPAATAKEQEKQELLH
jgi:hypothetical protein